MQTISVFLCMVERTTLFVRELKQKMLSRASALLVGGLLCIQASVTAAGEITVSFDDALLGGPQSGVGSNFYDSGFRFSPCHNYGIVDSAHLGLWSSWNPHGAGFNDSQFFAFQAGNGPGNPDYLGLSPGCGSPRGGVGSSLYVDHGGDPFSFVGFFGPLFNGVRVTSSKGGMGQILLGINPLTNLFAGSEWTDVQWINFSSDFDVPIGLDQVTFRTVPEPGILLLMSMGLMGVAFVGDGWMRRGKPALKTVERGI